MIYKYKMIDRLLPDVTIGSFVVSNNNAITLNTSNVSHMSITFNLYNVLGELIPDASTTPDQSGVYYPDLTNFGPYTITGLNVETTYYFQAVEGTSKSYKYKIFTGGNGIASYVVSLPGLSIITDQNDPNFAITQTSCEVIWDIGMNSSDDTSIQYYLALASSPETQIVALTTSPQTITGLNANTIYNFVVVSLVNGQRTISDSVEMQTLFVDVTNIRRYAPNPLLLLWDHPHNLGYQEQRIHLYNLDGSDTGIDFGYTQAFNIDGVFSFQMNELLGQDQRILPNKEYYINVYCMNSKWGYKTPEIQLADPFITLPTAVSNVAVDTITSTGSTVSWLTPITPETGVVYSLQLLDSIYGLISDKGSQVSPYFFTDLTGDTVYNVNILATNASGSSTSSISFTTLVDSSTIATIESISNITSRQCDLVLGNFTTSDTITYDIKFVDSDGALISYFQPRPTSSSVTITGLSADTDYNLIIITNTISGNYDSEVSSFRTFSPPSISLIDNISPNGCRVNWSASTMNGVTHKIFRVDPDGSNAVEITNATSSPTSITGLLVNTPYNLIVRATNNSGVTDDSLISSFITIPSPATNLARSNISYNSCDVSWTSPGENDVVYSVQLLDSNNVVISELGIQTSPYTITGLSDSTTYNYNIISYHTIFGTLNIVSGTSFTTLLSLKDISATFSPATPVKNTNAVITITLTNDDGSNNTTEDPANISVSGTDGSTYQVSLNAGVYTSTVTSANAGLVGYDISHTNFGTTSASITWNNGGGGGGSGGGGENNGGNEHNNMAEVFHWGDDTLAEQVTQTTEITLAGESTTAPLTKDVTIEVPVSLSGLLSYSGAYTATLKDDKLVKTYPMVTVDLSGLLSAAVDIDGEWRDEGKDLLTSSGNTSVATLQGHFKNDAWNYADPIFGDSLPIEATLKVENKPMVCSELSTIFGRTNVGPDSAEGSHPVDLFEQMLAAGKISKADLSTAPASGSAQFVAGDSFSVYVTYTLTKTRKFLLDVAKATKGTAKITFNGVTLTAASTLEESADPIPYVVEWKFVHPAA